MVRAGVAGLLLMLCWTGPAVGDPEALAEAVAEAQRSDPALAAVAPEDLAADLAGLTPEPALLSGRVLARLGGGDGQRPDGLAKADLTGPFYRLRLRHRQYRDTTRQSGGSLEVRRGPLTLAVGGLGVHAGLGLLAAGPGRSGGLSLDGCFAKPTTRVTGWTLGDDPRAFAGGALGLKVEGVRILGFAGNIRQPGAPRVNGALVGVGDATMGLTVLAQMRGTERGGSLAGRGRLAGMDLQVEAARWQAVPGAPWHGAGALKLGWRPDPRVDLQANLASGPDGRGPGGGLPVVEMGDWGGWGWSLAGRWRPRRGYRFGLLVARGRWLQDALDAAWIRGKVLEARADLPGPARGRVELRVRWQVRNHWDWSAEHPWLPPAQVKQDRKTTVSAAHRLGWPGGQVRLQLRAHHRSGTSTAGLRYLGGLDGSRWLTPHLRVRGGLQLAWGDPVDLIGAVVPVPGLVVPRHWGHWASERVLGLQWDGPHLRVAGGLASRTPDPSVGGPDVRQGWVELSWNW